MCGIVGVVHLDGRPVSGRLLQGMTDILAHRGPDGEGHFIDGSVGLGHRRLAVIDPSPAGHQPMASAKSGIVLTYNGEIYNFRNLRVELEALGHSFHARTDTEVVLRAYEQWGEQSIERFNGMFAMAVWDPTQRRVFLARDRYGVKPLYYWHDGSTLVFASEIKAIALHPEFRAGVDSQALMEYFTFQNVFSDRTLFKDVRLIPPGHVATIAVRPGAQLKPRRYWDFNFEEPSEASDPREYQEELRRLFGQAVQRQTISDVPLGAYLSGGMDSGAITAVAAAEMPYLASFTAGFDLSSASGIEMGFDERRRAEALSYLYKTEHYQVILKAGDMERILPELVYHLEDPRIGQCYPNYYVARLASKFVTVVLSGAGGDELLAGYPWRYYRAVGNSSLDDYIKNYFGFWQRLVPGEHLPQVFQSHVYSELGGLTPLDLFRSVINQSGGELRTPEDYVNRSLYFEAKTFLHGLLVVEDKLSMAHGLETRVPFLDNDLVDFAMRLPVRTLLRDMDHVVRMDENETGSKRERYYRRTNDGKRLFREAISDWLPQEYVEGHKQGFSAPDASWFRGESIDYVRQTILSRDAKMYEFL